MHSFLNPEKYLFKSLQVRIKKIKTFIFWWVFEKSNFENAFKNLIIRYKIFF
jgi:hypothetical protein